MPLLRNEIAKLKNNPQDKELNELCLDMLRKDHVFSEDIDYIYQLFTIPVYPQLRFMGFLVIKAAGYERNNISRLADLLECQTEIAEEIIRNEMTVVSFPVVNNHSVENEVASLAAALVIPVSKSSFNLYPDKSEEMRRVASLANKNYFVLFNLDIIDRSYMLALYAALTVKNKELHKKYAYSGMISPEGKVFACSNLSVKNDVCTRSGKELINGDFTLKEFGLWLETGAIPFPMVVLAGNSARDGEESVARLVRRAISGKHSHFNWECLKTFFGLTFKDLSLIKKEELSPGRVGWTSLINGVIRTMTDKIFLVPFTERRELHVFGSISTLMFAQGVLVRDTIPFTVYHYLHNDYVPVVTTVGNPRALKKRIDVDQFEKISFTVTDPGSSMGVIIHLASHDFKNSAESYLKKHCEESGTIFIQAKNNQGNLSVHEDWSEYICEIYSLLNDLKDRYNIERYHLFLGSLVSIAFGLGAALGNYWDITVYQYNSASYDYFAAYQIRDILR